MFKCDADTDNANENKTETNYHNTTAGSSNQNSIYADSSSGTQHTDKPQQLNSEPANSKSETYDVVFDDASFNSVEMSRYEDGFLENQWISFVVDIHKKLLMIKNKKTQRAMTFRLSKFMEQMVQSNDWDNENNDMDSSIGYQYDEYSQYQSIPPTFLTSNIPTTDGLHSFFSMVEDVTRTFSIAVQVTLKANISSLIDQCKSLNSNVSTQSLNQLLTPSSSLTNTQLNEQPWTSSSYYAEYAPSPSVSIRSISFNNLSLTDTDDRETADVPNSDSDFIHQLDSDSDS